ncbi:MAG TPA: ABC transporter permease [Bryobacteraceae bacterium]|jgi:ABC-type transport system involved in multi-copper enzyme maturation permease subunit|nr:ABC transporter permease [Bryobacteraceae bacterium]
MNQRAFRLRQAAAILRLEWKKSLLSRRAWWVYLLALGPVFICGLHTIVVLNHPGRMHHTLQEDYRIYAGIFQVFYLRLGIFFGCVGIFSNLFRGEVLEKTLHYYFLAPVRREILVAGKYAAGLISAILFFAGSAVLAWLLIGAHFGPAWREFILSDGGLAQLGWYALTAALACVGYGAVFLVLGLLYRNPMVPAAAVMLWEGIQPFLPGLLQKFSVIFYLKSLVPVQVPVTGAAALIAVAAEPTPAWIAILGLLAVSALILYLAARRARRLEISYGE